MRISCITCASAVLLLPWQLQAANVAIEFVTSGGIAMIDPFDVPIPDGPTVSITPSIVIDSGSFTAVFESDSAGVIQDGPAGISGMSFEGNLAIEIDGEVDLLGTPIAVTATLAGPLNALQNTDSEGSLAGLSAYIEDTIGEYNFIVGPLDCSDSLPFFDPFCALLETGLNIEFPVDAITGESTPVPFVAGLFADLNSSGGANVTTEINFEIPFGDTMFGAEVDFVWDEVSREVVPEPSATLLGLCALSLVVRRRRSAC